MPDIGYRLVLRDPETLDVIGFDLKAQEVTTEIPHLLHVSPLPGGKRHIESQGEGVGRVTLRHTYGQAIREINGEIRSGNEAFQYFERAFWSRYLELKRKLPHSQQKQLKVEFHDWERDRHHYVEVERFENPRSPNNRMYLEFVIELLLIEEIKPEKVVTAEPDNLTRATRALADFNAQTDRLKRFGLQLQTDKDRLLSQVNRTVLQPLQGVTSALSAFVNGVTGFVALPLETINTLSAGIETTIANIGNLATVPLTELAQELRQVRRNLNRLRAAPQLFRDSIDGKLTELRESFFVRESASDTTVQRTAIQEGQNAARRALSADITALSYQAGRSVTLKANDTLQRIAKRELGDPSQWRVLAELNDLQFPYISTTGEPNTVAPGAVLLIPVPATTESPAITQSFGDTTVPTAQDRVYGVDFKTTFNARGKIDRVWEGNDFVKVGGLDNFAQAIDNRMVTRQGDLLEDEGYGFPDNRGKKSTEADYLFLKFQTEQSLKTDSRVQDARVDIQVNGNVAELTYNVRPIKDTTGRPVEGVVSV